jgi:hypothetical protein
MKEGEGLMTSSDPNACPICADDETIPFYLKGTLSIRPISLKPLVLFCFCTNDHCDFCTPVDERRKRRKKVEVERRKDLKLEGGY